jgi:GT2 family glycosyltransferase
MQIVSILVINWNGVDWLPKCLQSIYRQTFTDYEVIIVDNASTDDSIKYIRKEYPASKILANDKNIGFAGAIASGLRAARGDHILVLNTDIWFKPNFLETLIKEKTNLGYDVIAPIEGDYETGTKRSEYISTIDPLGHPVYKAKTKNNEAFFLTGVALLFSKDIYEESGGMDTNFFMYCEEVDWFWRLILLNKQFGYTSMTAVYHKSGASSGRGLNPKVFLWRNQNTLQMLIKNYSIINLVWSLPLYVLQNVLEIIGFVVTGHFKIAITYPRAWGYVLKNAKKIRLNRRKVQAQRKAGDWVVMRRMYKGSGKAYHLLKRFKLV